MTTAPEQLPTSVNLLELSETVSRLVSHKGVEVVQILNKAGDIITESRGTTTSTEPQPQEADENATTADAVTTTDVNSSAEKHPHQAALVKKLLNVATTYVQSLEDQDEVAFLQIRSKGGRELMVAPHEGYALVVLKRS